MSFLNIKKIIKHLKVISLIFAVFILISAIFSLWWFGFTDEILYGKLLKQYDTTYALAPVEDIQLNKWGYINKFGKYVIRPKFDHAQEFKNGCAVVLYKGNYGYIDKNGNYLLVPQYLIAYSFSQGRARVCVGNNLKNALWGVIDNKGNYIVEPKYTFIADFIDSLAVVNIGGKYDSFQLTEFNKFPNNSLILQFGDLKPEGGKWGYIGLNGEIVIPMNYTDAGNFSEGVAFVAINGKYKTVIDTTFFSQGNYGFIDKSGLFKIIPKFVWAGSFRYGIAPVCIKNGNVKPMHRAFGYIGKDGNFRIKPQFSYAGEFENYVANVRIGLSNDSYFSPTGEYFDKIDTLGNILLDQKKSFSAFKFISRHSGFEKAHAGLDYVGTDKFNLCGFVNNRNKYIIRPKYSSAGQFSTELDRE